MLDLLKEGLRAFEVLARLADGLIGRWNLLVRI
jgi:hypothetical protein